MSPMLKSAEKVGIRALREKRNPSNIKPDDFFTDTEVLRKEFANLINAQDPKRIVVIPSVSYGMANVANNLPLEKGKHVIVAADQFPSNYYAWEKVCAEKGAELKVIGPEKALYKRGQRWNEKILESISANTTAVAIAHTHWTDGTKFDLKALRKRTREVNALLIVDGSQSVGALPFDVENIRPDALVCAGYKWLLGPYSTGLAYYGEFFNNGKPIEESWMNRLNSEDFSSLISYQSQYQPGALRFEVGEHSNFIGVPMLLNSISQLNRWHVSAVQEYCASISADAISRLRSNGFWVEEEEFRGSHLFGIRLQSGDNLERIKNMFNKNRIHVSFRGDSIRVSPNVYNDESDLNKLAKTLIATRK
jgi:selenocysteine lyase/cysteine desulfurase